MCFGCLATKIGKVESRLRALKNDRGWKMSTTEATA